MEAVALSDFSDVEIVTVDLSSNGEPQCLFRGELSQEYAKTCTVDFAPGIGDMNRIITGHIDGSIQMFVVPPAEDNHSLPCQLIHEIHAEIGGGYPVTQLELHRESGSVFALHDKGESNGIPFSPPGGAAAIIDYGERVEQFYEVYSSYDLCTLLPLSSCGKLIAAGSVKHCEKWDGRCPYCEDHLPVSLCHHQHRSAAASLVFFDLRSSVPGRLVHRLALPHRSLYPRMQLVREHFLLLSHAAAPLAVWDRRYLAEPLACPNLDLSDTCMEMDELLPEGLPRKRSSNGIFLSANSTVLAGRSDEGAIRLWPLSSLLGWEDGTPPPRRGDNQPCKDGPLHVPIHRDMPGLPILHNSRLGWPCERAEVWLGETAIAGLAKEGLCVSRWAAAS